VSLLTSLISWWALNEASGNAVDSHGANTLTETSGTIASATGKVGNCRDFEAGDTEYFERADNADLSTGDIDFTIACWLQLESKPANPMEAASKFNRTENQREYTLGWLNTTDRLRFLVSSDGGNTNVGQATANNLGAPSTGVWYFVVCWHDAAANTVNIQVNNGTVDSTAYSLGVLDGSSAFRLGAVSDTTAALFWDGLLDEVAIWKRVLTTDEKTWLYNGDNGRSYSEVLGHRPTASRLIVPNLIGGRLVG
jgi:hypothetical protein